MKGLFFVVIAAYVAFCATLYVASYSRGVNQAPVIVATPSVKAETAKPITTAGLGVKSRPSKRR